MTRPIQSGASFIETENQTHENVKKNMSNKWSTVRATSRLAQFTKSNRCRKRFLTATVKCNWQILENSSQNFSFPGHELDRFLENSSKCGRSSRWKSVYVTLRNSLNIIFRLNALFQRLFEMSLPEIGLAQTPNLNKTEY